MINKVVRVGWQSDNHLGYQQYGLIERRRDFAAAFINTIHDMIATGVDILINTGDILHSTRPGPEEILKLQEAHEVLIEAGKVMLLVEGNHDHTNPHWTTVLRKSDFGIRRLQCEWYEIEGLRIVGVPFMAPDDFRKLKIPDGDILMMHQSIQEFVNFESPGMLKIADLPVKKFQVIAIGDIHEHNLMNLENPNRQQNCLVGYPGSTEMNSESEPDEKKWVELRFMGGRLTSHSHHPVRHRQVIRLRIENEVDLESGLKKLKMLTGPALFFVSYRNDVPLVIERCKAVAQETTILQFRPIFVRPKVEANAAPNAEKEISITGILKSMAGDDPAIFNIASQLLNQEIDAGVAIDEFVKQQLAGV